MDKSWFNFYKYSLLFIVTLSFLGTGVLSSFNYDIGREGGSFVTKIHPIVYVLLGISLINLIHFREGRNFIKIVEFNRFEHYILFLILLILGYLTISNNSSSVSFIVNSLMCPAILAICLFGQNEDAKRIARRWSLTLILINSIIAVVERVVTHNFFPVVNTYGEVFRSTALLGHPLNNALITLIFVLYVLSIYIPIKNKILYLFILYSALICYGARGALYVGSLAMIMLLVIPVLFSNKLYYRRLNRGLMLGVLLCVIGGLVFIILNTPLGERLVHASFYDDSADVRAQVFDILNFSNFENYLFASNQSDINRLGYQFNIDIIENFYIIWVLRFGLLFATALLLLFYFWFYKRMPMGSMTSRHIIIILFFIAAATNNSLATNTTALSFFIILFGSARKDRLVHNQNRRIFI